MARPPNLHRWLAEPLLDRPGAVQRRMFGAESIYLDGVLTLVLADGEPPWNGLLFPVERSSHPAVLDEFAFLGQHPILPKWLYLPASEAAFESRAQTLIARLVARDPRFGVLPAPRSAQKSTRTRKDQGAPPRRKSDPSLDGRPPHLR